MQVQNSKKKKTTHTTKNTISEKQSIENRVFQIYTFTKPLKITYASINHIYIVFQHWLLPR